ncbi:MAG: DUF4131 domain-containing protein [Acidobacteria bacterium]|nr:DUF4131 domain-containing protein [Acidobacteriota bacterium]
MPVVGVVGLLPALATIAGSLFGLISAWGTPPAPAAAALLAGGWAAWWARRGRLTVALVAAAFFAGAAALAVDAREGALRTPLRSVLDRELGGFAIGVGTPAPRHDPIGVRAVLLEDAAVDADGVRLRADVVAIQLRGRWQATAGTVGLLVAGAASRSAAEEWRAGRTIHAFATFRRPARYLNEGVPDFERALALDGVTLFGSVKSGLLVDVESRAGSIAEAAAVVRRHVRRSVERWVAPHDPIAAAIVTAVLIGDRTGLPDEVRLRLQAAGTYHVIAISGGNIGLLAAVTLACLHLLGMTGRRAAACTVSVLAAYAMVVTAAASVWRATLMGIVYFSARLLDHRTGPWHAIGLAATLILCVRPLDVRDAGFLLTFAATGAFLEAARSVGRAPARGRLARWLIASMAASAAAEAALLPVSATTFSRVTSAGLVLNLAAVPLMGVVQIGGMAVAIFDACEPLAAPAGWLAGQAASMLVGSAALVDVAPWLAARVPPPPLGVVALYYAGLALVLLPRPAARLAGVLVFTVSAGAIVTGRPIPVSTTPDVSALRLTMFDVGQGEAVLVQLPDRSTLLIDAGGTPFGSGGAELGSRVLAPALWAGGLRRLDRLLLTHGDPDHIGGAPAAIDDFHPSIVWEGIAVHDHAPLQAVLARARARGARVGPLRAGEELDAAGARIRPSPAAGGVAAPACAQ